MPIGAPVDEDRQARRLRGRLPDQAGRDALRRSPTRCRTRRANRTRARSSTKDENTYLIVPNGVTLKGEGLNDLGHGAAHPGAHLRLERAALQGRADGRGGRPPAAPTRARRAGRAAAARRSSRSCRASVQPGEARSWRWRSGSWRWASCCSIARPAAAPRIAKETHERGRG